MSDTPLPPQLVRAHMRDSKAKWEKQEERTRTLEEAVTEHRLRLDNGILAFRDLREDHKTMGAMFAEKVAELTPVPVSPTKIVGIVLAIVMAAAGALWGLSGMLNDRPTDKQIHLIMDSHETNGHKATRDEIRAVQTEQAVQKTMIEGIGTKVGKTDQKLDELLDRVPAAKPH